MPSPGKKVSNLEKVTIFFLAFIPPGSSYIVRVEEKNFSTHPISESIINWS
jgi:hypothetical protein